MSLVLGWTLHRIWVNSSCQLTIHSHGVAPKGSSEELGVTIVLGRTLDRPTATQPLD